MRKLTILAFGLLTILAFGLVGLVGGAFGVALLVAVGVMPNPLGRGQREMSKCEDIMERDAGPSASS